MRPDRHTLHAGLGMASLLTIGIATGVALDRTVLLPAHAMARPTAHGDPAAQHREAMRDLAAHVGMTAEQAGRVEEVFALRQAAVHGAWQTARERLRAVVDSATVDIEGVLDADQQERFHEWIEERHGSVPARLHDVLRNR